MYHNLRFPGGRITTLTPFSSAFVRVSTDGQSVAVQATVLAPAGAAKAFREVASGMKTKRTQFGRSTCIIFDQRGISRPNRVAQRCGAASVTWAGAV